MTLHIYAVFYPSRLPKAQSKTLRVYLIYKNLTKFKSINLAFFSINYHEWIPEEIMMIEIVRRYCGKLWTETILIIWMRRSETILIRRRSVKSVWIVVRRWMNRKFICCKLFCMCSRWPIKGVGCFEGIYCLCCWNWNLKINKINLKYFWKIFEFVFNFLYWTFRNL